MTSYHKNNAVKWNPPTLLVGINNSAATVENKFGNSSKSKTEIPLIPFSGICPKEYPKQIFR